MNIREILAVNLRRLRQANDMTQEDLADRAGVDRGYISKLENAKKEAGLDILPKLAKALEVQAADLLTPPKRMKRET
jgi:transcriptional regulator with XRE-family HTH domain